MKSTIYEYLLFYNPENELLEIIDQGTIAATTFDNAKILAARKIPSYWMDRLDEIEVLVRPFVAGIAPISWPVFTPSATFPWLSNMAPSIPHWTIMC